MLALVAGASRSGKTFWTAQQVARSRRLWVWDAVGEFCASYGCRPVSSAAELHALALSTAPVRAGFVGAVTRENFDTWCRFAWVWMRANAAAGHGVDLVVEELADVTSPGKAPAAWGEIVRKGQRFNPRVYGLTQRPAESDKTLVGNASLIHVHAMARADDRRSVAREMDIPQAAIDALDLGRFEWLELDRRRRQYRTGAKGRRPQVAQIARATA